MAISTVSDLQNYLRRAGGAAAERWGAERMLILVDIEALMSSADMGLMDTDTMMH